MKILLLLLSCLTLSGGLFSQPLTWAQLGSDPAYCRLFSYQSGNGVVYALASGGTPTYNYLWTNLETGATTTNTTWGGLNPGFYEITVTDGGGATLTATVEVDSLNPIASFEETSGSLTPIPEGWVGFLYAGAQFNNQSTNFANPNDPGADTTFFWNLNWPAEPWQISYDVDEVFSAGYGQGTYALRLVTLNNNGCSDTMSKQVHIFGPAAIDEGDEAKFISIYSTHHQNLLYFNCGGFDENMIVEIFSISGELVTSFETSSNHTEVIFNSSVGIYLYTVKGQKSQEILATGKLIH